MIWQISNDPADQQRSGSPLVNDLADQSRGQGSEGSHPVGVGPEERSGRVAAKGSDLAEKPEMGRAGRITGGRGNDPAEKPRRKIRTIWQSVADRPRKGNDMA
jgi:hypothetical protein